MAVVGALGAVVVPSAAEVVKSECRYQVAVEASKASDQGRPPGDPGLACEIASLLRLR